MLFFFFTFSCCSVSLSCIVCAPPTPRFLVLLCSGNTLVLSALAVRFRHSRRTDLPFVQAVLFFCCFFCFCLLYAACGLQFGCYGQQNKPNLSASWLPRGFAKARLAGVCCSVPLERSRRSSVGVFFLTERSGWGGGGALTSQPLPGHGCVEMDSEHACWTLPRGWLASMPMLSFLRCCSLCCFCRDEPVMSVP